MRGTGLLVGQVGLPRVGKQRKDCSNPSRRTSLASRYHDAKIHEVVVELASIATKAGLDDIDILAANRVLNFATALSGRELGQDATAGRETKVVAHTVDKLGVGVATQNDDVSDHVGVWRGSRSGWIKGV